MKYFVQCVLLYCLIGASGISVFADEAIQLDRIPFGDAAADFSLPDQQGKLHRLEEYSGKYLLVTFWLVGCSHCRQDMASLEHVYQQLQEFNVEVLAINAGDSLGAVNDILKLSHFSYTVLLDSELTMGDWGIPEIPTTYLLGPDGQRLYRAVGPRNWNSAAMLNQLTIIINQSKKPSL